MCSSPAGALRLQVSDFVDMPLSEEQGSITRFFAGAQAAGSGTAADPPVFVCSRAVPASGIKDARLLLCRAARLNGIIEEALLN
jgi:hypothetical protein